MRIVRIAMVGVAALPLAACSVSPSFLSTGFAGEEADPAATLSPSVSLDNLSLDKGAGSTETRSPGSSQVATLDDRAPAGSFEHAPKGALADRDYSHTGLNAEAARDLINKYRRAKGLAPLRLNAQLTDAAKAHSRDLAKWDRISHFGSDGSNPWDRVTRAGYNARLAAENVGTGQASFEEVLKGWEESPGHNKNLLLADGRDMGIALVQDPKTEFKSFWTLVIGSSK